MPPGQDIRPERRCAFLGRHEDMLKLRSIGIRDYSVFEGGQRSGRIRFAGERMPGVWLWSVVTLPGTDLEGVWRRCHDVGGFRSSETDLRSDIDSRNRVFAGGTPYRV